MAVNDAGYSLSVEHGHESSGISLSSTNAPLRLKATNALYASSDGGATVSCMEINR